jgi:hypothetical protein
MIGNPAGAIAVAHNSEGDRIAVRYSEDVTFRHVYTRVTQSQDWPNPSVDHVK